MLVSFHLIQNVIQELVTELVAFDVTKYPMKPYEEFFFFDSQFEVIQSLMEKRPCCPCQKRAENAMIKIRKYCLLPWHSWDVSLNVILQGWSSVVCFVQDNLSLPKVLTTSLSPPTVKDQVSKHMSLEDNISNEKTKKEKK